MLYGLKRYNYKVMSQSIKKFLIYNKVICYKHHISIKIKYNINNFMILISCSIIARRFIKPENNNKIILEQ